MEGTEMSTREQRERWRSAGAHATFGAVICFSVLYVLGDATVWALTKTGLGEAVQPLDDTDSQSGQRSNMELLTDYGTGCQYLRVIGGGITPRMDADGTQICTD
jgi:hypothetical protein